MSSVKEFALFCLGNPLLDIQSIGDQALLDKYGLQANDAVLASAEQQGLFEDLLANYDARLVAGGAAQNTARGAQYLLPPNSVVYAGSVGDDKYAAILHDAAGAAGLRVEYHVDVAARPTGRCAAVITAHHRSLCTELGAANGYTLDHLQRPDIWALVRGASAFFVGGYHLTVCLPAIMALAKEAAAQDKIFALSLSAPFIVQVFQEPLDATAPYWDYVIGNETEMRAYGTAHNLPATDDLCAVARYVANMPKTNQRRKRVAIVTQGTEHTLVATQGEEVVRQFPVQHIAADKINDTNGAGDAFAGGFMAGVMRHEPLERCVDMGHWLARLSIQELGPSYPFPKKSYQPS